MCMGVCLHEFMCITYVKDSVEVRIGIIFPGNEVKQSCELTYGF